MSNHIPGEERLPIEVSDDDAQVAGVVAGHDSPSTRSPINRRHSNLRVVIAVAVAFVCFSAASAINAVTTYRTSASQRSTISAQADVINAQGRTIDVERSRSLQLEQQVAGLQSQVNDQTNQQNCRSQIANDFEALKTTLDLAVAHRDQVFREALSVALQGDRDGFTALLEEAAALDPAIAEMEPKVAAAADARQESVVTCQKSSTSTTTTAPGG